MEQEKPIVRDGAGDHKGEKKQSEDNKLVRGLIVLGVAAAIGFSPVPVGLKPAAWHLLAIFVAVILGFILKPMSNSVVALAGVSVAALVGALKPAQALAGFSNPTVWTIVSAFVLATAFIKTGLGRRIAYMVIYAIGNKTLKIIYAILITDFIIAPGMSSTAARMGGMLYPIVRSLCTAFGSEPGPTARRIGSFLLLTTHHSGSSTSATFMTGSGANLLAVGLAASAFDIHITWGTWALGAIVPGLAALLIVPYCLYKVYPPEIKETPEARQLASAELAKIGKLQTAEKYLIGVFLSMLILWSTHPLNHIDPVVVALLGAVAMLLTRVIDWKDVLNDNKVWDSLIWMGGTVALADGLKKVGVIDWLAKLAGGSVSGFSWPVALVILVVCYFYSQYFFASIAARVTAVFTTFGVIGIAAGVPPALLVLLLCYSTHLPQAITHYSSGSGPIYFGAGYVDQETWWKLGFMVSVINFVIWAGLGIPWWKFLGLW